MEFQMMQFVELVPEVQSLAEAADAAPPGTTVWKSIPLRNPNPNPGTLAVYTWTLSLKGSCL